MGPEGWRPRWAGYGYYDDYAPPKPKALSATELAQRAISAGMPADVIGTIAAAWLAEKGYTVTADGYGRYTMTNRPNEIEAPAAS